MATRRKKKLIVFSSVFLILIVAVLFFASNYFFNFALSSRASSHKAQVRNINKVSAPTENIPHTSKESRRQGEIWFNSQPFKKIKMKSYDNLKLIGYFLPAAKKTNKLAVLAHGYGCRASEMGVFAKYYHSQGFNVFAPDDRAHGDSEGKYIGMGWLDRLDYLKWIKLLIKRLGPDTEIILHGRSMGGATVMMLSGEKLPKNVKCIIEDCGYTSVEDEFTYQLKEMFGLPSFPLINLASLQSRFRAGYSFTEGNSLAQVRKCKIPILFIHGGSDDYVPTKMVYKLYRAVKCKKELWVVPKAAHAEAYFKDKLGYEKRIKNFYSKYLVY